MYVGRALCFPRGKAARSPGARAASLCSLCTVQLCCLAGADPWELTAGEQPQEERRQRKKRLQEHSRVVPQSEIAASSWAVAVLDSRFGSTLTVFETRASLGLDVRHLYLAFLSGLTANTFLILAVCIYLNKNGSAGPHLDKKKIQRLPDHFGPARASVVLQQAVQACIDCAYHQKTVFSFLKQGHGGEVISGENWPAALCLRRCHGKSPLAGR